MKKLIKIHNYKKSWNFNQSFVYYLMQTIFNNFFPDDFIRSIEEWKYFKKHIYKPNNNFYFVFKNLPENKDLSLRGFAMAGLTFAQQWAIYRNYPEYLINWLDDLYVQWLYFPQTHPELVDKYLLPAKAVREYFFKVGFYFNSSYKKLSKHLSKFKAWK